MIMGVRACATGETTREAFFFFFLFGQGLVSLTITDRGACCPVAGRPQAEPSLPSASGRDFHTGVDLLCLQMNTSSAAKSGGLAGSQKQRQWCLQRLPGHEVMIVAC